MQLQTLIQDVQHFFILHFRFLWCAKLPIPCTLQIASYLASHTRRKGWQKVTKILVF